MLDTYFIILFAWVWQYQYTISLYYLPMCDNIYKLFYDIICLCVIIQRNTFFDNYLILFICYGMQWFKLKSHITYIHLWDLSFLWKFPKQWKILYCIFTHKFVRRNDLSQVSYFRAIFTYLQNRILYLFLSITYLHIHAYIHTALTIRSKFISFISMDQVLESIHAP
jgi:hypothetical protein